jgi:hypothetical protein
MPVDDHGRDAVGADSFRDRGLVVHPAHDVAARATAVVLLTIANETKSPNTSSGRPRGRSPARPRGRWARAAAGHEVGSESVARRERVDVRHRHGVLRTRPVIIATLESRCPTPTAMPAPRGAAAWRLPLWTARAGAQYPRQPERRLMQRARLLVDLAHQQA